MCGHLFGAPPMESYLKLNDNDIESFSQYYKELPRKDVFLESDGCGYYCNLGEMRLTETDKIAQLLFDDPFQTLEGKKAMIKNIPLNILEGTVTFWIKYDNINWDGNESGVSIYYCNYDDINLLWVAVFLRRNYVTKQLIKKGCDVNLPDTSFQTPLSYAIFNHDREMIKILLMAGAKIFCEFTEDTSPVCDHLYEALDTRDPKIFKMISKRASGFSQEHKDFLMCRASKGIFPIRMMKILIGYGATINPLRPLDKWWIPIFVATSEPKKLKFLLKQGANPNTVSNKGYTPIFMAIKFLNTECIRILLKWGADAHFCGKKGHCPLDYAMFKQKHRAAKFLLEYART